MNKRESLSVVETIAQLTDWFDNRFAHLTRFGEQLASGLSFDSQSLLMLSSAARKSMKTAAYQYLQAHEVVDGCGLIFSRTALGTDAGRLEWWVREDESRFARYSFGVVPGADRYYDYEQDEWFIRAFHEGENAAVGPFIDYLGVEVYIITLTVPAVVDGVRVGAVGNDIQLDDLERALLPTLLACDSDIVLVSSRGNVLVSNTPVFLPGEALAKPAPGYRFEPLSSVVRGMHAMVPEHN